MLLTKSEGGRCDAGTIRGIVKIKESPIGLKRELFMTRRSYSYELTPSSWKKRREKNRGPGFAHWRHKTNLQPSFKKGSVEMGGNQESLRQTLHSRETPGQAKMGGGR